MPLFRTPQGVIVSVPAEEADTAEAGGYAPVGLSEAGAIAATPASEDRGVLGGVNAAATGFLSGATLGASDYLLKGVLNQGQGERLSQEREAHPIAGGAGQVLGAVLPALAAPGSALGMAPSGLVSHALAPVIAEGRAIGGAAGVARQLVAGGVEGAIQNAGMYLSDTALGDRELSAEGLTAALGPGFAFGVGGGAAALGIEQGTIAARRLFSRVAGTDKAAEAAQSAWQAQHQATFEANNAAVDIAKAKLAEARGAREQAQLAKQQAQADLAARKVPPPDVPFSQTPAAATPPVPQPIEAAGLLHDRAMAAMDPTKLAAWDAANGPRLAELMRGTAKSPIVLEEGVAVAPQAAAQAPPSIGDLDAMIAMSPAQRALQQRTILSKAAEEELAGAVAEHEGARAELDDMLRRLEAPEIEPGVTSRAVPVNEFGALEEHAGLGTPGPHEPPQVPITTDLPPLPLSQDLTRATKPGEDGLTFDPVSRNYFKGEAPVTGSRATPEGLPPIPSEAHVPVEPPPSRTPGFVKTDRAAGGSQGGSWYEDEHGQQWFGKHYAGNTDRLAGEHVANEIYRTFGIAAPETKLVDVGGKQMLMSREIKGELAPSTSVLNQSDVHKGFVLDAWLGNRDVIGTDKDNIILVGDRAHRIDAGGATIWRAQGADKTFVAKVSELEGLRDPSRQAGRVFGTMKPEDVKRQLQDFATNYDKNRAAVERIIDDAPLSSAVRERIKTGLNDRATWLKAEARGEPPPLTDDEFNAFASERQKAIPQGIKNALEGYSGQGIYSQINGPLRENAGKWGRGGLKPLVEPLRDIVRNIDAGVAASPAPRDMVVFRGVSGTRSTAAMGKLKPGDVYVDPGFGSTSYLQDIGSDYSKGFGVRPGVQLEISIPEGYPAMPIPSQFPKEREILLPRDGRYIVRSVETREGGLKVIKMAVRTPDLAPPALEPPAGFDLAALDSRQQRIFHSDAEVRRGVPKPDQVDHKIARDVVYVVKPSELANVGVTGARDQIPAWKPPGVGYPPVEIGVGKNGKYFVISGNESLLAAAGAGDRDIPASFWPKLGAPESSQLEDIAADIHKAVKGEHITAGARGIPQPEVSNLDELRNESTKAWNRVGNLSEKDPDFEAAYEYAEKLRRRVADWEQNGPPKASAVDIAQPTAVTGSGLDDLRKQHEDAWKHLAKLDEDSPGFDEAYDRADQLEKLIHNWKQFGMPGGEIAKPATLGADQSLESLLHGTQQGITEGKSLNELGAPARAEYAAAKAEKTAASSEHFRAQAKAEHFEAGGTKLKLTTETKPLAPGKDRTTVTVTRTLSDGEEVPAATAEFTHRADELYPEHVTVEPALQRLGVASRIYEAAEKATGKKIIASETQTAAGKALSASRLGSTAEPDQFFSSLTKPKTRDAYVAANIGRAMREEGLHAPALAKVEREWVEMSGHPISAKATPDAVEDIAAVAAVATKYEQSAARLAEALGPEAPPAAQEAAKAFRAAEDHAERKTMERTTRAIDDHAEAQSQPDWLDEAKRLGGKVRMSPVEVRDLAETRRKLGAGLAKEDVKRTGAAFAKARAVETEASIGARNAEDFASKARTAAEASRPVPAGPGPTSTLGAIATTIGVAGELGVPGIPKPHDIPVIGPLLGTYLKYRAIKAAAGRFVGRIPATGDARAAALVARTKDKIATAVDRTIGLAAEIAPKARAVLVATSTALGHRLIDDGEPDAPKGSSAQQQAAVRIREIANAATQPELVTRLVRKELRGVTDPDLIAAAEQHLMARFEALNRVMPKAPPPNPYSKREWVPSPAAAHEVAQRLAVVHDPEAAFHDTTPAKAQTLRDTWPKVLEFAQQRLIERVGDIKHPVAYNDRLRNSLLFSVPLDDSMQPDHAAVLQSAHVPSPAAQPPQVPGGAMPSIAGNSNLTALYQTGSDRRAMR